MFEATLRRLALDGGRESISPQFPAQLSSTSSSAQLRAQLPAQILAPSNTEETKKQIVFTGLQVNSCGTCLNCVDIRSKSQNTVGPRFKGFLGTEYFCLLNPKSLKLNSLFYKELFC